MKCTLLIIFLLFQQITFSQVNTERFRVELDSNSLSHQLGVKFNYSNGNSDISQVGFNGRTDYKHSDLRLFLVGFYKRGSENFRISISKGFLHFRGIYSPENMFSTEFFLQKEFNKFIKLDDRNVIGSGIRIKWMKSKNTRFFSGIGFMNEHEKISETDGIKNRSKWRLTSYNSVFYGKKNWNALFTNYYQPNSRNFSDFRFLIESKLSVKLNKSLSIVNNVSYRFDNKPPENVASGDLVLSNGIEVSF